MPRFWYWKHRQSENENIQLGFTFTAIRHNDLKSGQRRNPVADENPVTELRKPVLKMKSGQRRNPVTDETHPYPTKRIRMKVNWIDDQKKVRIWSKIQLTNFSCHLAKHTKSAKSQANSYSPLNSSFKQLRIKELRLKLTQILCLLWSIPQQWAWADSYFVPNFGNIEYSIWNNENLKKAWTECIRSQHCATWDLKLQNMKIREITTVSHCFVCLQLWLDENN